MDSQFNSLIRSYSDNYIQYKVTGNARYKTAYESSQQGIDSILNQMENSVQESKKQISSMHESDIENKLSALDQRNKFLQRGLQTQDDIVKASQLRGTPSFSLNISTWQWIMLGTAGVAALGLSLL
jgi:hypothetical protein